jgi:hypothetical protein
MKLYSILLLITLVTGCDATIGKIKSLGKSAEITCWSGDTVIYQGQSSGKVLSEQSSDGYYFKDAKTGAMMEVCGNCVIKYLD